MKMLISLDLDVNVMRRSGIQLEDEKSAQIYFVLCDMEIGHWQQNFECKPNTSISRKKNRERERKDKHLVVLKKKKTWSFNISISWANWNVYCVYDTMATGKANTMNHKHIHTQFDALKGRRTFNARRPKKKSEKWHVFFPILTLQSFKSFLMKWKKNYKWSGCYH